MDRQEFSRQLEALQSQIFDAILSREVYMALWPTEEAVGILNRYKGFFVPVRKSLHATMIMGFAKIFDSDKRTMSLRNLLRVAKENTADLVPYLEISDIERMTHKLSQHDAVLEKIKRLRDQHLAHLDAKPDPSLPLLIGDLDKLVENLEEVFNKFSQGHNRSIYSWSNQKERSSWETSEILRALKEESERLKTEAARILELSIQRDND